MTDKDRFNLTKSCLDDPHARYNIGTYMERSQHLLLKFFYEPDMNYHEVPIEGYVADILNEKGITEIQTAGFRSLYDKLAVFLPKFPVTVVFPVEEKKRVCWVDKETGEAQNGRYTSYPRAGYKLLSELLAVVDFFGMPNFTVHSVSLSVSSKKLLDGYGPDKKKRATKLDTVPDELLHITVLNNADDIRRMLPFEAGERISSADLSKKLGLSRIPLWRATKFLQITEIIVPVAKKGNSIIYEVTPFEDDVLIKKADV